MQSSHDADVLRSGNAAFAPMISADQLLHKMTQLEGEVETMRKAFSVLKVKVEDVTSFCEIQVRVLKGKVGALETARARD